MSAKEEEQLEKIGKSQYQTYRYHCYCLLPCSLLYCLCFSWAYMEDNKSNVNTIADAVFLLQRAGINAEFAFLSKNFKMLIETISVAENSIAILKQVVDEVNKSKLKVTNEEDKQQG